MSRHGTTPDFEGNIDSRVGSSQTLEPQINEMEKAMKFILGLIVASFFIASVAAETTNDTSGWMQNGTTLVETNNTKSCKGFGAQLWLTDKTKFFEDWNKPTPGVMLQPTRRAIRGKPFFTVIIFVNPGVLPDGNCDVTGDIIVKKPDGTVYGEIRDANFWKKLPSPGNDLQLAVDYLGIVIEPNDPAGRYLVEAVVRDNVKGVELILSEYFTVEKNK